MKFTFACKKVSLNDSVKAYAEKKVAKLEKFFHEVKPDEYFEGGSK